MRLILAACAVLAFVPSVSYADSVATATVPFASVDTTRLHTVSGVCTWDGAVMVGAAASTAVPQTDALDITVRCTLYNRNGVVLAEAVGGSARPPVTAVSVGRVFETATTLCGHTDAYFAGGGHLSAGSCTAALPG